MHQSATSRGMNSFPQSWWGNTTDSDSSILVYSSWKAANGQWRSPAVPPPCCVFSPFWIRQHQHLSALSGLPTSISCQRCSKMVARAAFRCTGKRGSLLRMEWRRKGREGGGGGGGKRRCRGGRGEREGRINSNPSSSFFSVFQYSFASFPSLVW